MSKIKQSLKAILATGKHKDFINGIAHKKYQEHFKGSKIQKNAWRIYDGYDVLSEDTIRVYFQYGTADMEYDGNFEVKIA